MTGRTEVSREQLERDIRGGEIDTVLMVFPDLQGRLTGKRTTGRFFLESVADAGTENCDYLIACDMDNNPVPGYRFASYEQGYGDMLARADWNTVRRIPWVDKTAMIMCDLFDVETDELVEVRPHDLRRQEEAAEALGFLPMVASEIEFYLFQDTYDEAYAKGYRDLSRTRRGSRTITSCRPRRTSTSSARSVAVWRLQACRWSSPRARRVAVNTR
jgi:glutamine synthetase